VVLACCDGLDNEAVAKKPRSSLGMVGKWRGLAQATGLSGMTVSRIWHAFGLQRHRTDAFKLSPDPLLIDKVRDIAGLYINPPDQALVLCVDEKRHVQALDRTQRLLPMQPGMVRRTHKQADSALRLPQRP
jgi:hypothetical protein